MLVVVSGHLLAGLRLRPGAVEHGPPAPVAQQHQRAQQEEGENLGRVVELETKAIRRFAGLLA